MNPTKPNNDDHQLDDLLRNVDLPIDLKTDLRNIPVENPHETPLKISRVNDHRRIREWRLPIGLVLAATLAGIAAFLTWPIWAPTDSPVVDKTNSISQPSVTDAASPQVSRGNTESTLDSEFQMAQQVMEDTLLRLEIERLESRLRELNSQSSYQLDQHNTTSMILALSEKAAVDLGVSQESAVQQMVSIIDRYPNTQGAKIAEEFLNQTTY